ncbi:unnamed protein product [Musa acuminata var. zebrina]
MRMEYKCCKQPEVNYRKGLWSPDEDQKLRDYILMHGVSCWSAVPAKAGLRRNGKSCRLRWINYLRPGLKRGKLSPQEEETILKLQSKIGNKWSLIALHLPGRTDNEVKNYWNSYQKQKTSKPRESDTHSLKHSALNLSIPRLTKLEEQNDPILSCLKDSEQSVTPSTGDGSPKGMAADHLPKVLFADWFSFEQDNWESLFNLDDVRSSQVDDAIVLNGFKFSNTYNDF